MEIRLATEEYLDAYCDHLVTQVNQNGSDGIIFVPIEPGEFKISIADKEKIQLNWLKDSQKPGWERCWIAFEMNKIVGHIRLSSTDSKYSFHRVQLQMGVENGFKSQGIGRSLLDVAISWAQSQSYLHWIDLSVFEKNIPAIRLYEKLGFINNGKIIDCYRISNQSINCLRFSFQLK